MSGKVRAMKTEGYQVFIISWPYIPRAPSQRNSLSSSLHLSCTSMHPIPVHSSASLSRALLDPPCFGAEFSSRRCAPADFIPPFSAPLFLLVTRLNANFPATRLECGRAAVIGQKENFVSFSTIRKAVKVHGRTEARIGGSRFYQDDCLIQAGQALVESPLC